MNSIYDLVGLILLGGGISLGLTASKRRFDRTNHFGIQRYPTFESKLRSKSVDYVLTGSAIGLLVIGTVLLSSNHMDTWGGFVMAPVCLFMLYLLVGT